MSKTKTYIGNRVVRNDCITIHNQRYSHPALRDYINLKVQVEYDIHNNEFVRMLDSANELICVAVKADPVPYDEIRCTCHIKRLELRKYKQKADESIEQYNNQAHSQLGDLTPNQAWDSKRT